MANQTARDCPLAAALAMRLRASRRELTSRWLERIVERVSIDPNKVFPTDELLDHVPLLIDGIAAYLENPSAEISVDMPVVAKAMELGALRHAQGFDAYEILKEHEILGGILFSYLAQEEERELAYFSLGSEYEFIREMSKSWETEKPRVLASASKNK